MIMNYREQINDLLDRQDRKGLSKYGLPLEQSKAEIAEKLNHLAEELTDGLRYVLWVMDSLTPKSCSNCINVKRPGYLDPCASCKNENKWKPKEGRQCRTATRRLNLQILTPWSNS